MAGIREESGVLLFVNKGDAPKLYTPSQVKVGGSCTGGRGGGGGEARGGKREQCFNSLHNDRCKVSPVKFYFDGWIFIKALPIDLRNQEDF